MTRREAGYRPQKRLFQCSMCGRHTPAVKFKGRTVPGHIKHMYCLACRKVTEHVQIE